MQLKQTAAEEIGRKLDEFATEIVLGAAAPADPDRWAESLSALAAFARSSGRPEIATMAESVANRMRETLDSASDAEVRAELADGIERLREAVDSPETIAEDTAAMSLADDPELIRDFVLESREHLESIESQVLTLDRDPSNMEAVHSVFRSFHTIKGLAGFLGFEIIQNLTHEVETVLDLARNSKLTVTTAVIDVVLESKDHVSKWLKCLDSSANGSMPPTPAADEGLLARIHRFIDSGEGAPGAEEHSVEPVLADSPAEQTRETKAVARSVKVDTDKLDFLVDMVGEMVIAQSLVRHDPSLKIEGNGRLARNLSQLARITDEVQRTAMAMRMVPVGPLFQKMVRLVRDLSRKFGKQARVQTDGEDVELDRNIVEELADPLMHMIRNALDHGIETPEQRTASGKDPVALITLRAFHRSGHIVIEVSDDGRGINKKKVIERAQKNGLIVPTAQLTDAECHNIIFQPGFSTAEKVSDVSGRGVGMDVVRKQIQKLRGSVELQSIEGKGAIFSLRLPLTLAIIDGLIVVAGAERYILPLASVKELFRPIPGQVSTIEGRAEVVSVRDRLVPVLRLYDRFRIQPKTTDPLASVFVMAETDNATFCIMVDDLIGKQEVVIKNLGSAFRNVPGVAGGAILGDGRVGLILDLQTLFAGNSDVG
jgi:two-component system chemotaxis sensor kinase CheA